jgi:hypothetical protein
MKPADLLLALALFLPLAAGNAGEELLDILHSENGWVLSQAEEDGLELWTKEIAGRSLQAVMVRQKLNLDISGVPGVIQDITNYPDFLTANSGLQTHLVDRQADHLDGYQYLTIPLISDRHYLFRMSEYKFPDTAARVDWTLLPRTGLHSDYLQAFPKPERNPVYLDFGAGSWLAVPAGENLTDISYRLYLDPGGKIPDFLIDKINEVSIVNLFKDAVREILRRQGVQS